MKTNCIICKCEIDNWDEAYPEDEAQVHPIGGTAFRAYGHYGSSVFDPMDASYLEVVFCDDCLKERLKYTYQGVNQQYKAELDEQHKEQEELINSLLKGDLKEIHPHSTPEYVEWVAVVWEANARINSNKS